MPQQTLPWSHSWNSVNRVADRRMSITNSRVKLRAYEHHSSRKRQTQRVNPPLPLLFWPFFKHFRRSIVLILTATFNMYPNSPPVVPFFLRHLHPPRLLLFLRHTAAGNSTPSPPLCTVAPATGTLKIGPSSFLLLTFPCAQSHCIIFFFFTDTVRCHHLF